MSADTSGTDDPAWAGAPWTKAPVQVGPRFVAALDWAMAVHGTQRKKGSDVPYVAHLLAVAGLVLDDGGSEKQAAAALLHDVLEDTEATVDELRARFGKKVTRIVVACTDVAPTGKGRKKETARDATTWRAREERSIAKLSTPRRRGVLRVRAAGALVNARSIVADLRRIGPETWTRFHAGAVDQLWYHRSVAVALQQRHPGLLTDELRVTVREMENLAGWWFDLGDPQTGRS
ncbi:MAG: HD domain-containing protein [Acidimicrobiia bacterium]